MKETEGIRTSGGPGEKQNEREKDWGKIIIRHATAWFVLLLVGFSIWKMSEPVRSHMKLENAGKETTATAVTIIQGSEQPKKDKIKNAGKNAGKSDNQANPAKSSEQVRVTASALNVREQPDINAKIITTVARGTVLQVLESSEKWLKVKTDGGIAGYVSASPTLTQKIK